MFLVVASGLEIRRDVKGGTELVMSSVPLHGGGQGLGFRAWRPKPLNPEAPNGVRSRL